MATKQPTTRKSKAQKTPKNNSCPLRTDRIFVLDTNVLLHDPNALYAFKAVVIGIPFIVLEELDTFKRETGEKGRNAREVIRTLDELRVRGSLQDGVELNHDTDGAILKVFLTPTQLDFEASYTIKDNLILQTVHELTAQNCHATLVTKDINARVKADVLGLETEDYTKGQVSYEQFYKGWTNIPMPAKDLKSMTNKKIISVTSNLELTHNEFVILESDNNPENNRLFRFLGGKEFREVQPFTLMHTFGAKNIEQLMALDLLMDDSINIMTLLGPAGTGKTFLTLLAGLFKVLQEKTYRKFLIARPVVALGADIGYLPGDVQEKLHYWMQPVHDNLEFIYSQALHNSDEPFNLGHKKKDRKGKHKNKYKDRRREHGKDGRGLHGPDVTNIVERLQQKGVLSLEAITYMRGRSIPYQFVFIDEVQNLTPHEVKTLVSRAGAGTKVILAGDPYQIDSPYLDFTSNGLTVTTEKLKGNRIFGSVFLKTSERSDLAKLAAEVL